MAEKRLRDLPAWQQRLIAAAATVQVSMLAAALIDIWRRPQDQIRGPKRLWAVVSFINFAGPASYFLFGRRKQGETRGQD
jgi:hypothetical protein